MSILKEMIRLLNDEEGLTTVEYAIAGALVAATVVVAFTGLGDAVEDSISGLCTTLDNASSGSTSNCGVAD